MQHKSEKNNNQIGFIASWSCLMWNCRIFLWYERRTNCSTFYLCHFRRINDTTKIWNRLKATVCLRQRTKLLWLLLSEPCLGDIRTLEIFKFLYVLLIVYHTWPISKHVFVIRNKQIIGHVTNNNRYKHWARATLRRRMNSSFNGEFFVCTLLNRTQFYKIIHYSESKWQ